MPDERHKQRRESGIVLIFSFSQRGSEGGAAPSRRRAGGAQRQRLRAP